MTGRDSDLTNGGRQFTHLDATGGARMVDVTDKTETKRSATAVGHVLMDADTRSAIAAKALPKGDVFTVARVAAVLAAKQTGNLIPLCHPLPLTDVQIDLTLDSHGVSIEATAVCIGRTGVEMEALTAVTVAALTVYDMCKSADKRMTISEIRLTRKSGGRSGDFEFDGKRDAQPVQA